MKDKIDEAIDSLAEVTQEVPKRALTVHDTWEEQQEAEQFKYAITVKDLVAKLLTYPQDLKVGVTGHFGEFHGIGWWGITKYTKHGTDVSWVEISGPNIGEPPD